MSTNKNSNGVSKYSVNLDYSLNSYQKRLEVVSDILEEAGTSLPPTTLSYLASYLLGSNEARGRDGEDALYLSFEKERKIKGVESSLEPEAVTGLLEERQTKGIQNSVRVTASSVSSHNKVLDMLLQRELPGFLEHALDLPHNSWTERLYRSEQLRVCYDIAKGRCVGSCNGQTSSREGVGVLYCSPQLWEEGSTTYLEHPKNIFLLLEHYVPLKQQAICCPELGLWEILWDLEDAIEKLSDTSRTLLEYRVEGKSWEEVSELLREGKGKGSYLPSYLSRLYRGIIPKAIGKVWEGQRKRAKGRRGR